MRFPRRLSSALVAALFVPISVALVASPAHATGPTSDEATIKVNEFYSADTDVASDPIYVRNDWIELYNPSASQVDLTGWLLEDTGNSGTITLSGSIAPGGFSVVFPDDASYTGHFGLKKGDTVTLVYKDGTTQVDQLQNTASSSHANPSWARTTDGGSTSAMSAAETMGGTNVVAGYSGVTINEFYSNGNDFVELYNNTNTSVDITGWTLKHSGDTSETATLSGSIAASGYAVVYNDGSTSYGTLFGVKKGDTISLYNASSVLQDVAQAPANTHAEPSWARIQPGVGLWEMSTVATPGTDNDFAAVVDPDDIVRIDSADPAAGTVTLANTGDDDADISGWTIQDAAGTAITVPASTTLAAGVSQTFTATPNTFGAADTATLYHGTTAVDSFAWDHTTGITINEVSSDNGDEEYQVDDGIPLDADGQPLSDPVELYNSSSAPVDLTGWLQTDSGHTPAAFGPIYVDGTESSAMTIPAHGYAVFSSNQGLSSGGDAVRLYTPAGALVDSIAFAEGTAGFDEAVNTNGSIKSLAACGDGSDSFLMVTSYSFGASNAAACATGQTPASTVPVSDVGCDTQAPGPTTNPVSGAVAWPGSAAVAVADDECAWISSDSGQDLSGLAFDPSDPATLWAVKNKSVVYQLQKSGGLWEKVTDDGWGSGKTITFPGGTGKPDSEGMTVGSDGNLYVTTERDNDASNVALDTILQIDPAAGGTTLTAAKEWDLTSDLFTSPTAAEANLGFEGVAYVPDSYLTQYGFIDDHTGTFYEPSSYPDKVTDGLFFAAVEETGHLRAYALNADGSYTRVADIATGMASAMDVSYDPDLERLWVQCDNTCGVTAELMKIGSSGHVVADRFYARPAGLPDNNLEGFAVAPVSTAVGGEREVVWSDDGNYGTSTTGAALVADDGGHSLWSGLIDVDLGLGSQGYVAPSTGPVLPPSNPVTGGDPTTPIPPAPSSPEQFIASRVAATNSGEPSKPVSIDDPHSAVQATATGGVGTLQVGGYNANPLQLMAAAQGSADPAPTPAHATGVYFDVRTSSGATFGTVQFSVASGGGHSLQWWNPTVGSWTPVTGASFQAVGGRLGVTLSATSSPSVSQLTGTIFAISADAPVSEPTGNPGTTPIALHPVVRTTSKGRFDVFTITGLRKAAGARYTLANGAHRVLRKGTVPAGGRLVIRLKDAKAKARATYWLTVSSTEVTKKFTHKYGVK